MKLLLTYYHQLIESSTDLLPSGHWNFDKHTSLPTLLTTFHHQFSKDSTNTIPPVHQQLPPTHNDKFTYNLYQHISTPRPHRQLPPTKYHQLTGNIFQHISTSLPILLLTFYHQFAHNFNYILSTAICWQLFSDILPAIGWQLPTLHYQQLLYSLQIWSGFFFANVKSLLFTRIISFQHQTAAVYAYPTWHCIFQAQLGVISQGRVWNQSVFCLAFSFHW